MVAADFSRHLCCRGPAAEPAFVTDDALSHDLDRLTDHPTSRERHRAQLSVMQPHSSSASDVLMMLSVICMASWCYNTGEQREDKLVILLATGVGLSTSAPRHQSATGVLQHNLTRA